ncbi:MAG: hypothetical protein JW754_02315 [Candidatus Aenigmarchaeota archaeon]|nr:hypothetical protein [Candidatus Aenigmarchaeota archaeon]
MPKKFGVCIRCGKKIRLDIRFPYCKKCYNLWSRFGNRNFQEKKCHVCGKSFKSTVNRPCCYECRKKG